MKSKNCHVLRFTKAQIRMGETIAILFIFFLLLMFGFAFYSKIQKAGFKTRQKEVSDIRAIEIAQKVSFLPELQCSSKNVITENCIDILKLDYVSDLMKSEKGYYFDDIGLGYSTITVNMIYPTHKTWILYDNRPSYSTTKLFTPIPISLYNATSRQYYFTILNVSYYPIIAK
jgi:hypothetical protein